MSLLDATYKMARYTLPFLIEGETTENIIAVLAIIKGWNPDFNLLYAMVNCSTHEINALEAPDPGKYWQWYHLAWIDETSQEWCYSTKYVLCQFFLQHVLTFSVSHTANCKSAFKNLHVCAPEVCEWDSYIVSFPKVLAPSVPCL